MDAFRSVLPPEQAVELDRLSRLLFELRHYRNQVLAHYGAADETELRARIECGELDEHPAWEHYLGARILADTREAARTALAEHLKGTAVPASLHLELAETLGEALGAELAAAPQPALDALVLRLANGIELTVRYAAPDAYSLRWTRGEAECGIDTAPVHRDLATSPNHFHDAAGRTLADPVTDPKAAPAENVIRLVHRLTAEPTLGSGV